MNRQTQAKGFSLIGVLAAVLVLAVIAFGGWYVWHKNQRRSASKPGVASQTNTSTEQQNNVNPDPTEGGKYLVIKEWGVRIPITYALRSDAYYVIKKHVDLNDSGSGDPIYGDVAYFSSHTISNHPGNTCTPSADAEGNATGSGPIAITQSDTRHLPNSDNDREVSNKWYSAIKGNGGLCYPGSTGTDEDSLITGIVQGAKQIQAAQ